MSAANPFNPRLVFGLIAAGIAAFAALLLLLAYGGGSAGSPRGGNGGIQSVAATGFKGLQTLVSAFHDIRLIDDPNDEGEGLLIVALGERTTPAQLGDLVNRRAGRPTLIILPKWITRPGSRPGWVSAIAPGMGATLAPLFGRDATIAIAAGTGRAEGRDMLEGISVPIPASPQVARGGTLAPLLALPGGGALVARLGEEPHYVVADPDLFNNHGLREAERARAAIALIERFNHGEEQMIDFALPGAAGSRGADAPSMLRLAFEPPFLAMTLALVAAALLAGLYGAFRFGAVRREERAIAFGKAALVENSAGLIRLAGREARLGGAYADVVRAEMVRLTGAPYWLQGEKLDAYLDRLTKGERPPFTALAEALHNANDRHALMAAARSLHQWKKDIVP